MSKPQLSFWHMLLPVLGLHALLLAYPLDTKGDLEAKLKAGKPIRVVELPPAFPQTVRSVAPKPATSLPRAKSTSPVKQGRTSVRKIATVAPKSDVKSDLPAPKTTPSPTALQPSPVPTPSPTPSSTQPSAPPSSDEMQMQGATVGCTASKTQDCFNVAQTNGRLFSNQIEAYFKGKGFELNKQELDDEHGMSVYQLSKQGHPKDYLHVFWDEEGTTYLRFSKILNHRELALMVRQSPS